MALRDERDKRLAKWGEPCWSKLHRELVGPTFRVLRPPIPYVRRFPVAK